MTTSRILVFERTRRSRSSSARLGNVWMKCPLTKDGPGSPVSPGGSGTIVAPSGPLLLRGTISTVSVLSLRFLPSSDTTRTQRRTGGLPRFAVQISPRLGNTLAVNVDLGSALRRRCLQCPFLGSFFLREVREISSRVVLQSFAVLKGQESVDCQVNRFGEILDLAVLNEPLQIGERRGRDCGRDL